MIDPPILATVTAAKSTAVGPQQLTSFRVGAVLNLQAFTPISPGQYQASLGGQKITLQSTGNIPLNSNLKVEVTRAGEQPEIRLLPKSPSAKQTATNALRMSLPQQRSLGQLGHDLNRLIMQPESGVTKQLQALVKTLPSARELTVPQQLKQRVENSGLFLEAKLSRLLQGRTPDLTADLKAVLLKVLTQLQTQPQTATRPATTTARPETVNRGGEQQSLGKPISGHASQATSTPDAPVRNQAQIVQGLLARIETLQLSNRADTRTQLRVDLPLTTTEAGTGNLINLSFIAPEQSGRSEPDNHEGTVDEEQNGSWQVSIAWQSEGLGASSARIWLSGKQLHIRVGLSNLPEESLSTEALDRLRNRLTEQNLQVGNLILEQFSEPPEELLDGRLD